MSKPDMGSIFHIKKSMKYSGHRKLLCELSKLSKFNVLNLLGYQANTDASILVYKFRPKRTGFNMYAEYTRPQLTFLASHPWCNLWYFKLRLFDPTKFRVWNLQCLRHLISKLFLSLTFQRQLLPQKKPIYYSEFQRKGMIPLHRH